MTAAITAAYEGLTVMILEKADQVGGTTAWSAGAAWLPGSRHLPPEADPGAPLDYLRNLVGNRLDLSVAKAMLEAGPAAVEFLEEKTAVRLRPFGGTDYRTDIAGASTVSRTLEPQPFDDRVLGPDHRLLPSPYPIFTIFHGMQTDREDLAALQDAFRTPRAFRHVVRLLARHYTDLARFGRSTRRLRGNALMGMLLKSALDAGVRIQLAANCRRLLLERNRVVGVEYAAEEGLATVAARRAVVLASGGFSANAAMRARHAPHADQHRGLPPSTNTGDGSAMAITIGARLAPDNLVDYCFTPVSRVTLPSGVDLKHPHFARDRCLPGCIAIGPSGRRFVNEGCSYHDFVLAMHDSGAVPAFLVCDHAFLRKYGLGLVRPSPFPYQKFIRNGYLTSAPTIAALARTLGVDSDAAVQTVEDINRFAVAGTDPAFGKGNDAHSRSQGDARHGPNPCLGSISAPPFYAIRIAPGDTGTTCGLLTNASAQVLGAGDRPIDGLYACGMDMNNPTRGAHPSSGSNIGPAIAFGYIAGRHMAAARG